jgi:hypothetical protein
MQILIRWCGSSFTKDLVFDLATYEKQVCYIPSLPTAPHISLLGVGCEKKATQCLGEKINTLSDPRVSFEEL